MPEIRGELRKLVLLRAGYTCEYCRAPERYSLQSLSVEHVVPRSKGGDDDPGNLAASCQGCNNYKYQKIEALDPRTGEGVPLFHPRLQRWTDHFSWSPDFTRIEGMTPIGRATVEALQLNRLGLVNLRRVLHKEGEHPPETDDLEGR